MCSKNPSKQKAVKMHIQTEAFLLGTQNLHLQNPIRILSSSISSLRGSIALSSPWPKNGNEYLKSKPAQDFAKSHNPTKCVLT